MSCKAFCKIHKAYYLVLLAGLLAAVPSAWSQAVYGSIFGTVTDTTGAVIPNATITVTDVSKNTSVTAKTTADGNYNVDHLIPDTYRVDAEAPGFTKTSSTVILYANTSPKVDLALPVAGSSNTVTVTTAAPLLQTDRADVSTILNSRALSDLPNLQRNFTAFELLTPGTSYIGWNVGQATNPQESQQIEVNGQLPFATGYQLDGTDNQDPIQGVAVINPNLDAVSEMQVISQNYTAEFGNAVAGMVTAQTKSGSNNFHGDAFLFRRSDAQQARDPFTQYTPNSIPSFVHNQFGGSIGGPIKKDKLFFFGDYQGLREKTGVTLLETVPTATAHTSCTSGGACDLSEYLNAGLGGGSQYQIYDPESNPAGAGGRTAFAGNVIPAARLSAPAVALMKEMPLPNTGNGSVFNNYAGSGSGGFNTDQFDVRVDDQLRQSFHAFGRYTRFNSSLNGQPVFGAAGGPGFGLGDFAGTDSALDQSVAAGGDYALSPRWLTDFRFGWFRLHIDEVGPDSNQPLGTQLGIPGVNQGDLSITGGLPQFQIGVPSNGANGSSTITYGTSAELYQQTESQYQVTNNWTRYVGSNHNVRFGGEIRFALNHLVGLNNNNLASGQFQFPGIVTAGTGSQGLGFATFLLGDVNNFFRTVIQNTAAAERQKRWSFYGQDTWRITPSLTLNYGVRWDLLFPESVAGKGQGGLLDLNTGDVRIAGYGPYGNNLNVNMEYTHVSPRVGLAYQFRQRSVLRVGYGRTYGMGWSGDTFGEVLTFSYPTAVVQNLVAPSQSYYAFTLGQGPPAYDFPAIPASGNYPLPNGIQLPTRPLTMRIPTLDAWNMMIEQELSNSVTLQVGYVGSHGIHNMFDSSNQANINQQTIAGFDCVASGAPVGCNEPINPATGLPYTLNERYPYYDGTAQASLGVNFGHPFGWTQSFRYNANQATTSYNALQVVFQKRFTQGFQILSNYTWSHARAHESDYYFMDQRADYGNSYYNRRNAFIFTGNWDMPFGHGKPVGGNLHGLANQLVSGFSLNGTLSAQTGLPFTPSYSLCTEDQDIDGQGGTLCRPTAAVAGGPKASLSKGSFDPISHTVSYFSPVATLAYAGQVSGPYVRPYPGTFGNIERDSLFGPGLINVDASLAKRFNLTERVSFQLTAQAFNVFNHPNLNSPSSCVDCGTTSGQITDILASQDGTTMRRLQFSGRFQF
ncbi:MAG TPA: TonB-dependent receptor [Acidobacteriaceae bacterium]|nr:TonB-dependent receptor [Acidobacteriaceae bacterium]